MEEKHNNGINSEIVLLERTTNINQTLVPDWMFTVDIYIVCGCMRRELFNVSLPLSLISKTSL